MFRITSSLNAFVKLSLFLSIAGTILAGRVFFVLLLALLIFMFIGFFLDQPREISMTRRRSKNVLLAGDNLEINVDIEITSGIGMVLLIDSLPGEFALVDGSNIKLFWKGFRPVKETLTYSVRTHATGLYSLNELAYEAYHCMDFKAPAVGTAIAEQLIEVRPRLLEVKKIRDATTRSRIPLPLGAIARMGIPTLDFRELRLYNRGDSFKYINWKATARATGRTAGQPIVNEYEKEGKKTVWIFLDRSTKMQFGVNVKNAFECALEAVNGLADYYLKQNCLVALCTFKGETLFIYPGAGKRQYHKILKELVQMKAYKLYISKTASLKETVNKYKRYLFGSNPLCIVVTRLTKDSTAELSGGIREMLKYTGLSRERFSVMVISISGYDLAVTSPAQNTAADILKKRDRYYAASMKKGIIWVDWNPARYSFTTALLQQVVKR